VFVVEKLENEFIEIVTYLQNNYLNDSDVLLLLYEDYNLYL